MDNRTEENRSWRSRKGGSVLESGLVLLLLLITIIGVFDMGQLLFFHQTFRERVRAGVRYAVVHTYDAQQIRNMVLYNSPTAPPGDPPGLFGLRPAMVTVTRYDQGTADDRIEVRISSYPFTFLSPLLAGRSLNPVFRAVMPIESLGATD
jgi:hypothetical protein